VESFWFFQLLPKSTPWKGH